MVIRLLEGIYKGSISGATMGYKGSSWSFMGSSKQGYK